MSFYIISPNNGQGRYGLEADSTILQKLAVHRGATAVVPVEGSYKGIKEPAFELHGIDLNTAIEIGRMFIQESILDVDDDGNAQLIFMEDLSEQAVGCYQEVDDVRNLDAYTFNPATGRAFAALG